VLVAESPLKAWLAYPSFENTSQSAQSISDELTAFDDRGSALSDSAIHLAT